MDAVYRHHVHSLMPCPAMVSSSSRSRCCGVWRCHDWRPTADIWQFIGSGTERSISAHKQCTDDHQAFQGESSNGRASAPRGGRKWPRHPHNNIHQDQIGPLLRYGGERLLAILHFRDLIVGRGEHIADEMWGCTPNLKPASWPNRATIFAKPARVNGGTRRGGTVPITARAATLPSDGF
jgi:hypothetical protein